MFFHAGRLNQVEFTDRVDSIITSPTGEKEHLHNTLIAAIYGNVTREIPDQGLAPWVSANDKPATATGTKPISGDAAERRLKGDVMQLPSRDRRRIKDIAQNDVCNFSYIGGSNSRYAMDTLTQRFYSMIRSMPSRIFLQIITRSRLPDQPGKYRQVLEA